MPSDKPNILVIMSDEHTADIMRCAGNDIIHTPNLDHLAARGVIFDAAYTTSPLCVPARLSFTAGKYISRVGGWNNNCWLPNDIMASLPHMLNAAGYNSLLCGKQHYDATRRYGFHDLGANRNRHFKSGEGKRRDVKDETVNTKMRDNRFAEFHVGNESAPMNADRDVTSTVTEFLQGYRRGGRPFFLFAGYVAPHFPLIAPQAYHDHYVGKVPMPVIPPGHIESQPRNYHHLRRGFGVVETAPERVRKGRELYYGLTEWLDAEVGKVLAALGDSEAAGNTVVVYTSDHGENIGEHGLWWKNCVYEHAARIPLIVSWPARWPGGQRRSQACSLVDLVQTLAEIGGVETPEDWDGDSLCGWMDDAKSVWKDFALSEYYGHNICSGFVMVRRERYKYIYHTPADDDHPAERELYDLEADPGEFTNLAADPNHAGTVATLHGAMLDELGEDPDDTEQRCRADIAHGYGRAAQSPKSSR